MLAVGCWAIASGASMVISYWCQAEVSSGAHMPTSSGPSLQYQVVCNSISSVRLCAAHADQLLFDGQCTVRLPTCLSFSAVRVCLLRVLAVCCLQKQSVSLSER